MIKTQIMFDHRNRTTAGKEGPVEVRITHNRKTYYIPTGVRVRRSEFAFQSIINRGDSDELNRQLKVLVQKITGVVTAMLEAGETPDAAEVKRRVWSPEQKKKNDTSRYPIGTNASSPGCLTESATHSADTICPM